MLLEIIFMNLGIISSGPAGLHAFSLCSWSLTSWLVMCMLLRLQFGGTGSSGRGGSSSIFEILAKWLLSTWALSVGWIFIWLSLSNGGGGLFLFFSFTISFAFLYHLEWSYHGLNQMHFQWYPLRCPRILLCCWVVCKTVPSGICFWKYSLLSKYFQYYYFQDLVVLQNKYSFFLYI